MKKIIYLFILLFCAIKIIALEDNRTIVVDRNGTGNFRNIQQAIDSVRAFDPKGEMTIYIKKGIYKEKIILPTHLTNVRLVGESRDSTIINYDDHAKINNMGTFKTYTFLLSGNDIIVENLTILNSATPIAQAVALDVEGDRIIIRNCRLIGNTDTIYTGRANMRQYFENCYIEGTTDFMFGPSTTWFENCTIYCKKNSYITAASTPENVKYGYIYNNCKIELAPGITRVFLGRPWRAYAMTLFMNTYMPNGILPEGWNNWRDAENEKTVRYMEYNNTGEGATILKRAKWIKVLTKDEVKEYTIENVLRGIDNWNPTTIN